MVVNQRCLRRSSHVAWYTRWSTVPMTSRFPLSLVIPWRLDDAIVSVDIMTYSPDWSLYMALWLAIPLFYFKFHSASHMHVPFRDVRQLNIGHRGEKLTSLVFGLATLTANAVVIVSSFNDAVWIVGCGWCIDRDVEGSSHAVVRYYSSTFLKEFQENHWKFS
jgi:hypothetical protein